MKQLILALTLLTGIALASEPVVVVKVTPIEPLSTHVIFVVDNSDSMSGIFRKACTAFRAVIPTDEWYFRVIVFSDRGRQHQSRWSAGSVEALELAEQWISLRRNRGVCSYGLPAMLEALASAEQNISVVLISDGGFTTACRSNSFQQIEDEIETKQNWRKDQGLNKAIIVALGIPNAHYSILCRGCARGGPHDYSVADDWATNKGSKPMDVDCQAFLGRLGTNYRGGYAIVHDAPALSSD